jgi:hypothetical protein
MELNINSPLYYKEQYGIDDDIYRFCQAAYLFFENREYSDTLKIIGIIPILAPADSYQKGEWEERVLFISHNSVATVWIRMNLEQYLESDVIERKNMYKEMILNSIKKVKGKGKFDINSFSKDLEEFANSHMKE